MGVVDSGKSPVDRAKRGSNIHLLVDGRGAPLAVYLSGANTHDKWLVDEVILSSVVPRPDPNQREQQLCLDKGYAFADVHHFVEQERYIAYIKHRRRRNEPLVEACLFPAKLCFQPAVGLLSALSAGWSSAAVCVLAEPSNRNTGWPLSNLLALTFSPI
ncbi:MAG: transposase [Anaerolineae bacterium]|nr:transposase [Anaerolineae bacterium]